MDIFPKDGYLVFFLYFEEEYYECWDVDYASFATKIIYTKSRIKVDEGISKPDELYLKFDGYIDFENFYRCPLAEVIYRQKNIGTFGQH